MIVIVLSVAVLIDLRIRSSGDEFRGIGSQCVRIVVVGIGVVVVDGGLLVVVLAWLLLLLLLSGNGTSGWVLIRPGRRIRIVVV